MPHIHDLIDFTVEAFVVHKNKVLLRKHDKYNMWLSVGGHIELDEDPNQAALREVKEEVGLDVKIIGEAINIPENGPEYMELIPPLFLNRHRINPNHEHVTLVYFATSDSDKLNLTDGEEKSDDCRWFTQSELKELEGLRPSVKAQALLALQRLATN
ncbi:MAG: NUDIX domain-containing protein [Candidatus Berkelbacteria bacterium]|nr:MAG: NUDIX domain-containing protein [Candidatus Berkelbacteria bacterium]QQG52071.1 MAG: NUDIX domain-containing protein [Candidatus Berkelbacteria bacterium]